MNSIYRIAEDNKETLSERIIFNFITAAELLGVMHICKDCTVCQEACNNLRQAERKVREDENKMD